MPTSNTYAAAIAFASLALPWIMTRQLHSYFGCSSFPASCLLNRRCRSSGTFYEIKSPNLVLQPIECDAATHFLQGPRISGTFCKERLNSFEDASFQ
jgi:hypothetical protein